LPPAVRGKSGGQTPFLTCSILKVTMRDSEGTDKDAAQLPEVIKGGANAKNE